MAKARVKINRAGLRQLRQSPDVASDIRRRANAIAASATQKQGDYVVDSGDTGKRARSAVLTDSWGARWRNKRDNELLRAIDAGR